MATPPHLTSSVTSALVASEVTGRLQTGYIGLQVAVRRNPFVPWRPPYWISISGFYFDVCVVIGVSFYICVKKFRRDRKIGGGVMTSYPFFKMAAIESEVYLRIQVWWQDLFKNAEIYLPAKFRWDISIHGWDKTTSSFGKRTAAILEFYFRFRF